MERQTVRQAMQQDVAQQRAAQQAVAQSGAQQQTTSHQKVPQGASQQKLTQQAVQQRTGERTTQAAAAQVAAQQPAQAAQNTAQHTNTRSSAQRIGTHSRQQRIADRRSQQKAQQKREAKRRKNNIMKILLCAILVLQVICAVQLFLVLRTADKIMDRLGDGSVNPGTVQENNLYGNSDGNSSMVSGNVAAQTGLSGVDGSNTSQNISGQNEKTKYSEAEDEDAWMLTLVNKWNEMEEGYVPELVEYAEGHRVDARIEGALRDMISGAKDAGYAIYLLSAYRDVEKQTDLYEAEVAEWRAAGYTQKAAEEKAGTIVAVPGTSEHHLGLAVDLVSSEHVKLDEGAEKTKGYKWLVAHCHEYGFILRYPNDATEITGIIYEPWHFRYVGVEAATEIMEAGITLEEYLMAGQ